MLLALGAQSGFFLFGTITPIKIAFFILAVGAMPLIIDRLLMYKFDFIDYSLISYFIVSFISIMWVPDIYKSLDYFFSFITCLILYFLIKISLIKNIHQYNKLLSSVFFIAILSCLFGVFQAVLGAGFMPGTDARSIMTDGKFRANGFFFDPNYFSLVLCTLWPLTLAFVRNTALMWTINTIILFTILLTLSRAAFVVLLLQFGLLFLMSLRLTARSIATTVSAIVVTGVLGLFILAEDLFGVTTRILTLVPLLTGGDFADNSTAERLDLLFAGTSMFLDHWVKGVGFGGFEYHSPSYLTLDPRSVVAHNTFLTVAAEQGIIGFGSFLFIFYTLLYSVKDKIYFRFIAVSLLGLMGSMFFLVSHYMPFVYFYFSLISLYRRISYGPTISIKR